MRPLKWPRSLLTARHPVVFDSWLLRRSLQCPHRSYTSAAPSVVDVQGRPIYYAPPASYDGTDEQEPFERWLQPELVAAVKEAFPSVKYATHTQRELFSAVRTREDVMLQAPTGSGKSFSIMLAMMSKARKDPDTITSLIIVPHRDLAFQYLRWIQRIHSVIPQLGTLESVAQILVRDSTIPPENRLDLLRADTPHILIGTPQAIYDVYQESPKMLKLDKLSTVVVDEIDYLIDWIPPTPDKYKRLKAERMMRKHPAPTRLLLDAIFHTVREFDKKKPGKIMTGLIPVHPPFRHRPPLIMTSATFRAPVRRFLCESSHWFSKERGWAKISSLRKPDKEIQSSEENHAVYSLGGTSIRHHVLVVSPTGTVRNLTTKRAEAFKDVTSGADSESSAAKSAADANEAASSASAEVADDEEPVPYNPHTLEAVAEAFALDVPRLALLVLPASAPVRDIIAELRKLGVNAQGLDVLDDEAGGAYLTQEAPEEVAENPTLLVSTLATTRGMDLPSLTHVFILGLPEDRPGDAYMHAAGRVGRFGRSGKVITVIEERQLVKSRRGQKRWIDPPMRMRVVLKVMGIGPTKLSHFA